MSVWLSQNLIYLININILVISFLTSFALLIIHTYFMLNNTTTWEQFSRRNITYLRNIKNSHANPFHESYLKNIFQFFCYFNTVKWENVYVKFKNTNMDSNNDTISVDSDQENRRIEIELSSD